MYFDIGANIGKWSLANLDDNVTKIIAVEASPLTFKKLKNNTEKYSKILCLNYAVCNSDEEFIDFYNCRVDTISTLNKDWLSSDKSRFNNYNYTTIKCKTITLDKLVETYGIPDLIKIDVEGGEFNCISSLTKKVNILCFEWASELNEITLKCLEHLNNLGYNKFSIQFEDNYNYRPINYTDIDDIKNVLQKTIPKKDWG